MDSAVSHGGSDTLASRLIRGVIGGVVAGVFFIAVTMWFVTSLGNPANAPLKLISSIALGKGALADGSASPALGMVVHLLLSAIYGAIFGLVAPAFRTNGTVALAGTAYGLVLYVVNFLVVTPLVLTQFKMANRPFELLVHLAFGLLLSVAFFSSGIRGREPVLAIKEG